MAKKSSATGKIVVGFFVVLLFPTGVILVQRYLGDQNVVVNVHNHPPASGLSPPLTTPVTPANPNEDAARTDKKEHDEDVLRPPLSPDSSRDLSGRWSGHWVDSDGGKATEGMFVKERPNGALVGGWCNGFKIQKGRRVGRDGLLFESDGGSYQVTGRVGSRGDRLLLMYTYTEARPGSAVVGIHRLTRDGINPSPEQTAGGWSGTWSGLYANSLGNVGSESIVLKDLQDGTISGVWGDASAVTGRITADRSAHWEQSLNDTGLYCADIHLDGDVLRTSYTVTYPAGSRRKGFKGVEWFVRGELPAIPPQAAVPNSDAAQKPKKQVCVPSPIKPTLADS